MHCLFSFQFPLHREDLCYWFSDVGETIVDPFFQFPLHREDLCYRISSAPGTALNLLSVPSSSGRSLLLKTNVTIPARPYPFSSLFIGKISVTEGTPIF